MITRKDPSSYVTRIRGLKESPQDIALRALRSITKSSRSAIQLENVPNDLLFGENVDLQRWTMILKDTDLKELSEQQSSGKRYYLDGSAQTISNVFAYFAIPQLFPNGLIKLNISAAKEVTDFGIAMIARKSPFLSSLVISGCIKITDVGLREIAMHCPKLQCLNISSCPGIEGVGIAAIAECCPYLSKLNISKNSIKNWSLQKIFRKSFRLEELIISYMRDISDEEIRVVAENCHDLVTLEAIDCFYLSDQCVLTISQHCKDLDFLDMSRCEMNYRITDVSLMALGQRCHSIRTLKVNGCDHISDVGLHWLSEGCKLIETLELNGCGKLTDAGMRILGKELHALTAIDISHAKSISDVGIANLAKGCKNLLTLKCHAAFLLSDPRFFQDDIQNHIPKDKKKENPYGDDEDYDILNTSTTLMGSKSLSALPQESSLLSATAPSAMMMMGAGGTFMTASAAQSRKPSSAEAILSPGGQALEGATMDRRESGVQKSMNSSSFHSKTNLPKKLEIWEESIGIVALVQACPLISNLDLSGCFRLNRVLGKAVSKLSQLRVLNLKGCNQILPQSLIHLFNANHLSLLEDLNLTDCVKGVTNDVLITLTNNCLKLKILNLVRCHEITGKGVKAIANMKLLEKLDLTGCKLLNDSRMVYIVSSDKLTHLQYLDCKDIPKLGDSFLAWMSMKNHCLLSFALKGTAVTQKGLYSVKDSFPYCELLTNDNFYGFWPKFRVFDRLLINSYATMLSGLTTLQGRVRKIIAKKRVANIVQERRILFSHIRIQSVIRGFIARRRCMKEKEFLARIHLCALRVIATFRIILARKRIARIKRNRLARMKHEKAIIVQCAVRRHFAKKEMQRRKLVKLRLKQLKHRMSIIIQSVIRMYLGKCFYYKKKLMKKKQEIFFNWKASIIQRLYRGYIARQKISVMRAVVTQLYQKRLEAVLSLQKCSRAYFLRAEIYRRVTYTMLKKDSATQIQSLMRGFLTRLRVSELVFEKIMKKKTKAAVKIQCLYRSYIAKKQFFERLRAIHQRKKQMHEAASKINVQVKLKIARMILKKRRNEYYMRIKSQTKHTIMSAVKIQSIIRMFLCQKSYYKKLHEIKNKWKELFDEKKQKRFFYNKQTGEIRWKIPQDLLDLIPNPRCDNCEKIDAMIECRQCSELFCAECFRTIHGHGRRKEHEYRSLYDYYGKRIDYGDGEEEMKGGGGASDEEEDEDESDEESSTRQKNKPTPEQLPHMTTQNGKEYYISSDSDNSLSPGKKSRASASLKKSLKPTQTSEAQKKKKRRTKRSTTEKKSSALYPCQWPTEIMQNEIQGWMLRVAPLRKPLNTYPKSGWEEYQFADQDYEVLQKSIQNVKTSEEQRRMQKLIIKSSPKHFYFNRRTFETTYEMPIEVKEEIDRLNAPKINHLRQQSAGGDMFNSSGNYNEATLDSTYGPDMFANTYYDESNNNNNYTNTGTPYTAGTQGGQSSFMYQTPGGTYRGMTPNTAPGTSGHPMMSRGNTANNFMNSPMMQSTGSYTRQGHTHNYYYYPAYMYSQGGAAGANTTQPPASATMTPQQQQQYSQPYNSSQGYYAKPFSHEGESKDTSSASPYSPTAGFGGTASLEPEHDRSNLNLLQQQQQKQKQFKKQNSQPAVEPEHDASNLNLLQQQQQQQAQYNQYYYNNPSQSASDSWYGAANNYSYSAAQTPGSNTVPQTAASAEDWNNYGYYDANGQWVWYDYSSSQQQQGQGQAGQGQQQQYQYYASSDSEYYYPYPVAHQQQADGVDNNNNNNNSSYTNPSTAAASLSDQNSRGMSAGNTRPQTSSQTPIIGGGGAYSLGGRIQPQGSSVFDKDDDEEEEEESEEDDDDDEEEDDEEDEDGEDEGEYSEANE
jgi:hypothetical protein